MIVCITGSNGYIGSKLATALLKSGHQVYGIDVASSNIRELAAKPNYRFVQSDIADSRDLFQHLGSVDVAIHCAALVHRKSNDLSKENYVKVNYEGTRNVVSALRNKGLAQFIFLSTVSVYGETVRKTPDGLSEPNPVDFYGESKLMAEKTIREFSKARHVPCTILRLCPVYGRDFLVNIAKRVYLPKRIGFYRISPGDQRISLCSVNNLIHVILACMKAPGLYNGTFVIKDRDDYSINEIIAVLRDVFCQHRRPVVSIPPLVPRLFLRSLCLFSSARTGLYRYQMTKIAHDSLFPVNKIRPLGIELRWNLESTLRDGIDL
jgi:nucleoside-diphosphate-sugar epimerase